MTLNLTVCLDTRGAGIYRSFSFFASLPSTRAPSSCVATHSQASRTANERRQKSNDSVRMCALNAGIHPTDRLSLPQRPTTQTIDFVSTLFFPVFSPDEDGTPLKHTSRWYRYYSLTTGFVCRGRRQLFAQRNCTIFSNCTILFEEWLWPSNEDRFLSLHKREKKISLGRIGGCVVRCEWEDVCASVCGVRPSSAENWREKWALRT